LEFENLECIWAGWNLNLFGKFWSAFILGLVGNLKIFGMHLFGWLEIYLENFGSLEFENFGTHLF
jgi:hypothetical protein